jgi:4-amino-4-deoxy-L-arabinose transferase-like glycosyltransferase
MLRRPERWLPAALGVFYLVAIGTFNWFHLSYEIDPDEGYNLMKVMLVGRGHALYREVWSDQPPGFTYLGVLFVRVFGEHVDSVRLVTMLSVACMVFALADLLRRALPGFAGLVAGIATTAMLPAAAGLSFLSKAAMIGLPAIALAVLSLWALVVSGSQRRGWLVAAGVLFAASLWVKLFTGFLLPVLALLLAWQAASAAPEARARSVLRAGAHFALGFVPALLLGFLPAYSSEAFFQLYATHVADQVVRRPEIRLLASYLVRDVWLYPLAALGLVSAGLRRNAALLAFGAFWLLSLLVVGLHSPLWYHHCLLISVPACVLAGFAVGCFVEWLFRRTPLVPRVLGVGFVAAGLLWLVVPLAFPQTSERERAQKAARELALDRAIEQHAPNARLMVTAQQVRAFRLGIPVPTELAVTSSKRFRSKQLTPERIAAIVRSRRPDVVTLDQRWPPGVRRALKRELAHGYQLVYTERRGQDSAVYVREPPNLAK